MRQADPSTVLERLTRDVGIRAGDLLSHEAVEAVDVVNHALAYSNHPDGRRIWSEVIREGVISDEAKRAVVAMVKGLNEALRAGDESAVLEICDCLGPIFGASPNTSEAVIGRG